MNLNYLRINWNLATNLSVIKESKFGIASHKILKMLKVFISLKVIKIFLFHNINKLNVIHGAWDLKNLLLVYFPGLLYHVFIVHIDTYLVNCTLLLYPM